MKKLFIFLTILVIPVLLITGCGKKENNKTSDLKTIELADDGFKLKTTFKYDPSLTISDIEYDDEGKSKELEFTIDELDLDFQMYYTESSKEISEDLKTSRSGKKYFKDFNFNKYNAYSYGDYDDKLDLNIDLVNDTSKNTVTKLFVSIDSNNTDTIVYDVFTQNTLQEFFNSIEVEKIK